jgi:hypothetical protein
MDNSIPLLRRIDPDLNPISNACPYKKRSDIDTLII